VRVVGQQGLQLHVVAENGALTESKEKR
jgi:hypothetical protein